MNRRICFCFFLFLLLHVSGNDFSIVNNNEGAIQASVLYTTDNGTTWIAAPFRRIESGQHAILARSDYETAFFFAQGIGEETRGMYWGAGDIWSLLTNDIVAYPMTRMTVDKSKRGEVEFILNARNATRNDTGLFSPAFWGSRIEDVILYETAMGNNTYEIHNRFIIFHNNELLTDTDRVFWVYEFRDDALTCVRYFIQFEYEASLLSFYHEQERLLQPHYEFDYMETEDGKTWNSKDSCAMIHVFLKDRWIITIFRITGYVPEGKDSLDDLDLESYISD